MYMALKKLERANEIAMKRREHHGGYLSYSDWDGCWSYRGVNKLMKFLHFYITATPSSMDLVSWYSKSYEY